jgi:hypothetical protein
VGPQPQRHPPLHLRQRPRLAGCGRLAVYAEPAETEIRDQVLTALESPAFLGRLMRASTGHASTDDKTISDQIRAIDERREELAAEWATGGLTRKEWTAARHALYDQLAKLTRSLSQHTHSTALAQFAAMEGIAGHGGSSSPTAPAAPWSRPPPTRSPSPPHIGASATSTPTGSASPGKPDTQTPHPPQQGHTEASSPLPEAGPPTKPQSANRRQRRGPHGCRPHVLVAAERLEIPLVHN